MPLVFGPPWGGGLHLNLNLNLKMSRIHFVARYAQAATLATIMLAAATALLW